MKRRQFLKSSLATAALTSAGLRSSEITARPTSPFKHSVCHWCYGDMSVDELAQIAKRNGVESVELLGPEDWPTLAKHGLVCAMANPPGDVDDKLVRGFNQWQHHDFLVPEYVAHIRAVANAGYTNLICFSGNRMGIIDEEGLDNCVRGLQKIMPTAERFKINICMELLNSRVDHIDHQCDRTAWGVELVQRVQSERFLLLYDIYHMQIMEGDVIRTIRDNHQYIGHYHTGGNPGRNEIDETQELNYRAIMQAIADTGYTGFVGQEFIPTRDPETSLAEAIKICTV